MENELKQYDKETPLIEYSFTDLNLLYQHRRNRLNNLEAIIHNYENVGAIQQDVPMVVTSEEIDQFRKSIDILRYEVKAIEEVWSRKNELIIWPKINFQSEEPPSNESFFESNDSLTEEDFH